MSGYVVKSIETKTRKEERFNEVLSKWLEECWILGKEKTL